MNDVELLEKVKGKESLSTCGLDLSLNHTGIIVMDYDSGKVILNHTIRNVAKENGRKVKYVGIERQKRIVDGILMVVKKMKIDSIGIESYSYGSRGSAMIQLAELGGIIRYLLWLNKIKYHVYAPQTLKKFMLGKGTGGRKKNEESKLRDRKQSKLDMIKEASNKVGFELSEDEADAYAACKLEWARSHPGSSELTNIQALVALQRTRQEADEVIEEI